MTSWPVVGSIQVTETGCVNILFFGTRENEGEESHSMRSHCGKEKTLLWCAQGDHPRTLTDVVMEVHLIYHSLASAAPEPIHHETLSGRGNSISSDSSSALGTYSMNIGDSDLPGFGDDIGRSSIHTEPGVIGPGTPDALSQSNQRIDSSG